MKKILKIDIRAPFVITCNFDDGAVRNLDLRKILDQNHKYSKKFFEEGVFNSVKIGLNGELYWDDLAEIRTLDGNLIPCAYDICPDFVYENSEQVLL